MHTSTTVGQPLQMQSVTSSATGPMDLQAQANAVLSLPGIQLPMSSLIAPRPAPVVGAGVEEDGEGEDDLFPAMADDDYSAQLSWQSQSKDNLKCIP
jgi:transcription initiation factor TFIID subunit 11